MWEQIIVELIREGYSYAKISKYLNHPLATVSYVRATYTALTDSKEVPIDCVMGKPRAIPPRTTTHEQARVYYKIIDTLTKEELAEFLAPHPVGKGHIHPYSYFSVAKRLGESKRTVKHVAQRYMIGENGKEILNGKRTYYAYGSVAEKKIRKNKKNTKVKW